MKSQRRHELQTNELADFLGKYVKAAAPYQNLIIFGCLAVVALAVAGVYFMNQNRAAAAAGWTDYFGAVASSDAESLEEIAQIHGDTDASHWSRLTAGDINLATGASMRMTDKNEAERKLKDAAKNYEAVLEMAEPGSMLLQRARFGLAQVRESLCDVKEAQELYQQIAAANPDTELGKVAASRREALGRKSVKSWYSWFDKQEPVPPAPPEGLGDVPDVSSELDPLMQRPEIALPGATDATDAADEDDSSAEPAMGPELVAPETADPDAPEDAPATSTPEDDKPVYTAPPAADPGEPKPADAKPAEATPAKSAESGDAAPAEEAEEAAEAAEPEADSDSAASE